MRRLQILQIFSRYLLYGGEEGSVYRIGDALQENFDVEYFIASSEELMAKSKALLPIYTYRNFPVLEQLKRYQRAGQFDCWQIHNVFPAVSPGAYTLATKLSVPIIHYLHNYRMSCVNGIGFTNGEECRKCFGGNFLPGVVGKCWRGSVSQSAMMAVLLADTRRRGLFDQVSRWIAISEAQKTIHIEMGIPADKIDMVPHFLDHDPRMVPPPFPANGYGLFIGRLSPEKGVNRLLDAWKLLDPTYRLVVAGDGPELPGLKEQAAALGLDNVDFVGFVSAKDQGELWANAAFSIVPSIWQEPFGMVVLEAWAKGRPVVAYSVGALPEIVTHGENGFLAATDPKDDLSIQLKSAFDAKGSLQEMGMNGYQRLLDYYSKSRWLDEIQCVYRNAGLIS